MPRKPDDLSFFRNAEGKMVIWQNPNFALWAWIVLTLLTKLVFRDGNLHDGLQHAAQAFLFVWAYLEIRTGESLFRQLLGGVVLASILASFFRT